MSTRSNSRFIYHYGCGICHKNNPGNTDFETPDLAALAATRHFATHAPEAVFTVIRNESRFSFVLDAMASLPGQLKAGW